MSSSSKFKGIVQIEQHTKEWYETRKNLLTASDVAAVMELNPFKSRMDVFQAKVYGKYSKVENEFTAHGTKFEPLAKDHFPEAVEETGLMIHRDIPWLGASPDGYLPLSNKLIEIKCPLRRDISEIHIPEVYWIQMQIQMEVCNVDSCIFFQCKFNPLTEKLEKSTRVGIRREKNWFKNECLPIINKFWNTVQFYKQPMRTRSRTKSRNNRFRGINKNIKKKSRRNYRLSPTEMLDKKELVDYSNWVNISKTRNYAMRDPLLDWLDMYGPSNEATETDHNSFLHFIGFRRDQFFSEVKKELTLRFPSACAIVYKDAGPIPINNSLYEKTVEYMRNNEPIIFRGILMDHKRKIYGAPDILIRDDMFAQIFKKTDLLSGPPVGRYYPVQVRFGTLTLSANGTRLGNEGSNKAYKVQLSLLNSMIPKELRAGPLGFLMGPKYRYMSKGVTYRGNDCFDRAGVVDFTFFRDKIFVDIARRSVTWNRSLPKTGHRLKIGTKPEMCPNMCNEFDSPWKSYKKKIATDISEITSVYMLGPSDRQAFFDKGIRGWEDIEPSDVNNKHASLILEANQTGKNILPKRETLAKMVPKKGKGAEFFVDFEGITNAYGHFNGTEYENREMIFMIGLGYIDDKDGNWVYEDFTARTLTPNGEYRIINDWLNRMKELDRGRNAPVYHWSHAEITMLRHAFVRHPSLARGHPNWFDLHKLFKEGPIIITGALNFKLKSIVKALSTQRLIPSSYDDLDVKSGLEAMMYVLSHGTQNYGIEEVKNYNEIDCKVLMEILELLRRI